MLIKFVLAFTVLALACGIAGSIPTKGFTYDVRLSEPAVVSGTPLPAGEYKVIVTATKVTFVLGKESTDIAAKVETGERKFDENQVQYDHAGSQTTIKQIGLGGSKTRLVFN